MPWFSWWRRKKNAAASSAAVPAARPLYVPGRETVTAAESHYVIPNDLREANRLDLQHFALHEYFGTNVFAPVHNPQRILDVASGTGRWAKELKAQFPAAQVTGLDVSVPLEIQEHGQPSEYTFVQANVLEPLPFPDASFDYVHMRFVFTAVPAQQWPVVVRALMRVTAPGGWIELVEAYLPTEGGPAFAQLEAWGQQLVGSRGIELAQGRNVGQFLREAGATSVTERSGALPIGPYGGRVGQIMGMDIFTGYRLVAPALVQGLGLDRRLVNETIAQADADVYSGNYQAIMPIYIAFGQRPIHGIVCFVADVGARFIAPWPSRTGFTFFGCGQRYVYPPLFFLIVIKYKHINQHQNKNTQEKTGS